jgi:hypothetical protein
MVETVYSEQTVMAYFGEAWPRWAASLASFHPRSGVALGTSTVLLHKALELGRLQSSLATWAQARVPLGRKLWRTGFYAPIYSPPASLSHAASKAYLQPSLIRFEKDFFRLDGVQRCYVQDESARWGRNKVAGCAWRRKGERENKR